MGLLRKCRVNAALTIQLFSQLFHFINRWTFNQIVTAENKNYCTHRYIMTNIKLKNTTTIFIRISIYIYILIIYRWGLKIKKRMGKVEQWAEKQGLELAAGMCSTLYFICYFIIFFIYQLLVYPHFRLSPSSSRPSCTFVDGQKKYS